MYQPPFLLHTLRHLNISHLVVITVYVSKFIRPNYHLKEGANFCFCALISLCKNRVYCIIKSCVQQFKSWVCPYRFTLLWWFFATNCKLFLSSPYESHHILLVKLMPFIFTYFQLATKTSSMHRVHSSVQSSPSSTPPGCPIIVIVWSEQSKPLKVEHLTFT